MRDATIIGFDSNYLIEITGGVELDIKELLRVPIRINKKYRMFVDMISTMDSLIRVGIKIRLYTFPMNVCLFIWNCFHSFQKCHGGSFLIINYFLVSSMRVALHSCWYTETSPLRINLRENYLRQTHNTTGCHLYRI